jgi:2-polyprenyl-3-methyl-5-hydroxy-6-metoxy-1,4-benzoquinol methylase
MDELSRWLRKRNLLTTFIEILQKVGLLKITFRIYQKLQARLSGSNQQYPTRQAQAPELPIPSSDLIVLVAGTPDVNWFLSFGASVFEVIRSSLHAQNIELENLHTVMDFGCGCGRVLRYWSSMTGPRLYGVDYNTQLIDWCQRNLPFAEFHLNH